MKAIEQFHAHVYFDNGQLEQTLELREQIKRRFQVMIGRVHERPVGPHSKGMFQVVFVREQLAEIIPWLMQHRHGLSILIHGDTGDDYIDHTRHTLWLGDALPLRLEIFAQTVTA